MNSHPFHNFIELIDFDQAVHALLQKQKDIAEEIKQLHQQKTVEDELYAHAQRAFAEARKTVDILEREMKELVQEEKDKKKKLDQITHYKESQVLQREIDHLRSEQHKREDALLHAWHTLESCERAKNEQHKKHTEYIEQLRVSLNKIQHEQTEIGDALAVHEAQREEQQKNIPEEWLQKYEAMRLRVTDPVVPIENNNCSACFHELSSQEIIRLSHGALLECKLCFRFLYHKNILTRPHTS